MKSKRNLLPYSVLPWSLAFFLTKEAWQPNAVGDSELDHPAVKDIVGTTGRTPVRSEDHILVTNQALFPDFNSVLCNGRKCPGS